MSNVYIFWKQLPFTSVRLPVFLWNHRIMHWIFLLLWNNWLFTPTLLTFFSVKSQRLFTHFFYCCEITIVNLYVLWKLLLVYIGSTTSFSTKSQHLFIEFFNDFFLYDLRDWFLFRELKKTFFFNWFSRRTFRKFIVKLRVFAYSPCICITFEKSQYFLNVFTSKRTIDLPLHHFVKAFKNWISTILNIKMSLTFIVFYSLLFSLPISFLLK